MKIIEKTNWMLEVKSKYTYRMYENGNGEMTIEVQLTKDFKSASLQNFALVTTTKENFERLKGFKSEVAGWNEKYQKVALAALEVAALHIDLSDNTEELKPCPFCGEEAEIETDPEGFHVSCSGCGAFLGSFTEKKDASKAWDQRNDD